MNERSIAETIRAAVDEKLRFIAAHREQLVEAWFAEHGLKPSESMLIEHQTDDGRLLVWVERQVTPVGTLVQQQRIRAQLQAEVERLQGRVAELERELAEEREVF